MRVGRLIWNGIDKLGTLTAHRLVRWEITVGYQQFLDRERHPETDPRIIKVLGGYGALAREHLGLKSNADIKAVRDIIREQSADARGRQAVRLVLGTMLLPRFADLMKLQEGQRGQSVKLVPMTDLPPWWGA